MLVQVCTLRSEAKPPQEAFNPAVKRSGWQTPQDTGLWELANEVKGQARPSTLPLLPLFQHGGGAPCSSMPKLQPAVLHHRPGRPSRPAGTM